MSNIKIDTSAIDLTLTNYIVRTEQIKRFVNTRKEKLNFYQLLLKEFVEATEAESLEIGDMLSDGEGSQQYKDSASLVCNCVLTFNEEPIKKNTRDQIAGWLQELWNDIFEGQITASFTTWQIDGKQVKFKIFINDKTS